MSAPTTLASICVIDSTDETERDKGPPKMSAPNLHTLAKKVSKTIAGEIVDALFGSMNEEIIKGIWSAVEKHVYAELKQSRVSLWIADNELEMMFSLGENSDEVVIFQIEDLHMPEDPVEWAIDYPDDEDIRIQMAAIDGFIEKMLFHKTVLEATIERRKPETDKAAGI